MSGFDEIWQRIVALQGKTFRQKTGKPFRYRISGNSVVPSTTNRLLARSQFDHAFARAPLHGPGQLQDLQGPSYLFAILTDPRVTAARPDTATADPDHERGPSSGFADNYPRRAMAGRSALLGASVISPDSSGSVSAADWLRHANPRQVLLVIPCSKAKARGGQTPRGRGEEYEDWPEPLHVARARVLAGADLDGEAVLPAWQRYQGGFYRHARPALAEAVTTGNVIILSGGYGVAHALELIGWYDKVLRLADWPAELLESALIRQARRVGADTVVAFAAQTTAYAQLLRCTPWREAGLRVGLVTIAGVTSGAMAEIPRQLGLAFAAFWNQQHDSYSPGTVVEELS